MVSVNTLEKAVLEELHKLNEQYLDEERLGEQAEFNHRTLEQIETCKKQIAEYQKRYPHARRVSKPSTRIKPGVSSQRMNSLTFRTASMQTKNALQS